MPFKALPYCIAELSLTYQLREAPAARTKIISVDDFVEFITPFYGDQIETRELFFAVFLNQANHVVGVYHLGAGGITGTVADIRLILAMALQLLCNQIMITHNHPSGNLQPSSADRALTHKLQQSAGLMDMRILDHVIVTRHGHASLNELGFMS